MFAKLFSRITESSLMEEPLDVRYAFVMLLAMCDATGCVIGTDIAIARRMNMPIGDFRRCLTALIQPDKDSNSKEEEGRRIVPTDHERGYRVVNYLTYRDMKTEENRREYMRNYMRQRRESEAVASGKQPVKRVNNRLAVVNHTEEEAEEEGYLKSAGVDRPIEKPTSEPTSVSERFKARWNLLPDPFPKIQTMSQGRCAYLRARLKDPFWKSNFETAMRVMVESDFLKGKNDRGWVANVDYFLRPDSVAKIVEGKYEGNGHLPLFEEPRGEFAKPMNKPPEPPPHVLAARAAAKNGK